MTAANVSCVGENILTLHACQRAWEKPLGHCKDVCPECLFHGPVVRWIGGLYLIGLSTVYPHTVVTISCLMGLMFPEGPNAHLMISISMCTLAVTMGRWGMNSSRAAFAPILLFWQQCAPLDQKDSIHQESSSLQQMSLLAHLAVLPLMCHQNVDLLLGETLKSSSSLRTRTYHSGTKSTYPAAGSRKMAIVL